MNKTEKEMLEIPDGTSPEAHIKSKYSNIGATSIFVGYVRDYNNEKIYNARNRKFKET